MRQILNRTNHYLHKEPRNDSSDWFWIVAGILLLCSGAILWFGERQTTYPQTYTVYILLTAGLSQIAGGLAELLPPRQRASAVVLRATWLILLIVTVVILGFLIISVGL